MSYLVELLRPIRKDELLAIVDDDAELSVVAEGDDWLAIAWSRGDEQALFNFARGRLSLSTPSQAAAEKSCSLAERLGAIVLGEEDGAPSRPAMPPGIFAGRSSWIGWPVLVIILTALLAWKW